MLTFLPRFVRKPNTNTVWGQQINLANGSRVSNCEYCIYRDDWETTMERYDCVYKHGCSFYMAPFVAMTNLHNADITSKFYPPESNTFMYRPTWTTRQITLKGWPLYLNLIMCNDITAHCNANCWYHDARLQDKLTVPRCAHSHKCSRAGSFWDLFVPAYSDIRQQFYDELNSMQP